MNPFKTIIFCVSCLLLFTEATVCIDAKIVFRVDDDIWVMNDDRTGRRRLTHNTTMKDSAPRWSPDGAHITFEPFMQVPGISSKNIYVMSAAGQHPRPLLPVPK